MHTVFSSARIRFCVLGSVSLLIFAGCGKSNSAGTKGVLKPKEAAAHLQNVFSAAPPEIKQNAMTASEALRSADYGTAVQSLQSMNTRKDLTLEQGLAVYDSMVALEAKLIAESNAGNVNAKQAYEALKNSRRH